MYQYLFQTLLLIVFLFFLIHVLEMIMHKLETNFKSHKITLAGVEKGWRQPEVQGWYGVQDSGRVAWPADGEEWTALFHF